MCERLKFSKKRPLIKNTNIEETLNTLTTKREKYYNEADLIINNTNEINSILIEIKKNLNKFYE